MTQIGFCPSTENSSSIFLAWNLSRKTKRVCLSLYCTRDPNQCLKLVCNWPGCTVWEEFAIILSNIATSGISKGVGLPSRRAAVIQDEVISSVYFVGRLVQKMWLFSTSFDSYSHIEEQTCDQISRVAYNLRTNLKLYIVIYWNAWSFHHTGNTMIVKREEKYSINLFWSLVYFSLICLCYWIAFLLKNVLGFSKKIWLHSLANYPLGSACLHKIVHNETVNNCQHPMFYRVVTLSGMHQVITDPDSLNLLLLFSDQMPLTCSSPTFLLHSSLFIAHKQLVGWGAAPLKTICNCCKISCKRWCPGDSVNRLHFSVNIFEKLVDYCRICIFV